jgi:hypothetical protein
MTTLTDTISARTLAGAAYLAAVAALRAAYVDLAAYDWALSNSTANPDGHTAIHTFNGEAEQEAIGHGLVHPDFCTRDDIDGAWGRDAMVQGKTYLAAIA